VINTEQKAGIITCLLGYWWWPD